MYKIRTKKVVRRKQPLVISRVIERLKKKYNIRIYEANVGKLLNAVDPSASRTTHILAPIRYCIMYECLLYAIYTPLFFRTVFNATVCTTYVLMLYTCTQW